jgi:hypothetical protein
MVVGLPPVRASANLCSELGACGALPPGNMQPILSAWAGGHGPPGPHASRTARRASPGEWQIDLSCVGRHVAPGPYAAPCGAAGHVSELIRYTQAFLTVFGKEIRHLSADIVARETLG